MGAGQNLEQKIIVYTFGVSGLKEDGIIRIMEDVPVNIKDTVMNTLDIFVEKGKRENAEKVIRNMIREGLPTELISKVLEVSSEYVARIREEFEPRIHE